MAHYYDQGQSSPLRPAMVTFMARGQRFSATTWSGVFSREGLDRGTEALLKYGDWPSEGTVLDLGCGWGAVALTVKTLSPSLRVTASDVNERAVKLTRKNLADNGFSDVDVVRSDGLEKLGEYECILFNPPYAAGRSVCFSLIDESHEHLSVGGSLQLVARHQKGGAALEKHMQEVFGNVTTLGKQGGFRIYKSVR